MKENLFVEIIKTEEDRYLANIWYNGGVYIASPPGVTEYEQIRDAVHKISLVELPPFESLNFHDIYGKKIAHINNCLKGAATRFLTMAEVMQIVMNIGIYEPKPTDTANPQKYEKQLEMYKELEALSDSPLKN